MSNKYCIEVLDKGILGEKDKSETEWGGGKETNLFYFGPELPRRGNQKSWSYYEAANFHRNDSLEGILFPLPLCGFEFQR